LTVSAKSSLKKQSYSFEKSRPPQNGSFSQKISIHEPRFNGKQGPNITRIVEELSNKVVLTKNEQNWSWRDSYGSLGYLSQKAPTRLRVTFKYSTTGCIGFGIARRSLRSSNFTQFFQIVRDDFPFYGIYPRLPSNACNIADFGKQIRGKYKNGDSFELEFDPVEGRVVISGERLEEEVVRKVKGGRYFPIVFLYEEGDQIEIEFLT
jgi:hypothetical protein